MPETTSIDQVCNEINAGILPKHKWHELLHINYHSDLLIDKTFLTYAVLNLKDGFLKELFEYLENLLGEDLFKQYLFTPNNLYGTKLSIFAVFLEDHGMLNKSERKGTSEQKLALLKHYHLRYSFHINKAENIDTHTASIHRSADESHIRALKKLEESNVLEGFTAIYPAANEGDIPRSVEIRCRGNFNHLIDSYINNLIYNVKQILEYDSSVIFDNYIKFSCADDIVETSYINLSEEQKLEFDKRANFFKFQASAALTLLKSDYITCGITLSCGLSFKEILGVCYHHCHVDNRLDELRFISAINWLYDIQRGRNIDNNQDIPEMYIYSNAIDERRCYLGSPNQIASILKSLLPDIYILKIITKESLSHEINIIYKKLVNDNITYILGSMSDAEKLTWLHYNKITGNISKFLELEYTAKYKKDFENQFKGYIDDPSFNYIVGNALNSIEPHEHLSGFLQKDINSMQLLEMIWHYQLSFLIFDGEKHTSTLEYFLKLRDNLLDDLNNYSCNKVYLYLQNFFFIVGNGLRDLDPANNLADRRLVNFISKSNYPEFNDVKIKTTYGKDFCIKELSSLNEKEIGIICSKKDYLQQSVIHSMVNLFMFSINKKDINKKYGLQKRSLLHTAAIYNSAEIYDILVGLGADTKSRDLWGYIPLEYKHSDTEDQDINTCVDELNKSDITFCSSLNSAGISGAATFSLSRLLNFLNVKNSIKFVVVDDCIKLRCSAFPQTSWVDFISFIPVVLVIHAIASILPMTNYGTVANQQFL